MNQLLKKALMRGVFSYLVSVTVTIVVGLVCSLAGAKAAWTPEFSTRLGSELTAAYLQPLLIGLIGFAFGAGSILFRIERWSYLQQGAVHLLTTSAVWVLVTLVCFAPLSAPTVISFAASYIITWGVQYFVWRAGIRRLNRRILEKNGGIDHERH